jgi:hypothetical protein
MLYEILYGLKSNNYDGVLAILSLSTFHSVWRNLGAIILINVLKNKMNFLKFWILLVYVYLPGQLDYTILYCTTEWSIFFFPRRIVFPLDPRAKKPLLALFLKTNSQFSLSLTILIQK